MEFGATGCIPCDMMQPILENLRKSFKDRLNVIFVHVRGGTDSGRAVRDKIDTRADFF